MATEFKIPDGVSKIIKDSLAEYVEDFKDNLTSAMETFKEVLPDLLSDGGLRDGVDEWFQSYLDDHTATDISFDTPNPALAVWWSDGNVCLRVPLELSVEDYKGHDLSEPHRSQQREHVREQISNIDLLIDRLTDLKQHLASVLPSETK